METIPAKTIVTRTKGGGWFGIDYNMNIYRGCCHGCIYCDSRSDCYQIKNFDTVKAKDRALEIIRDDLRCKVKRGVVGTGAMSYPYNPFEKKEQLTRHALELVSAYGFGAAVATKSDLITRDIDVLQEIAAYSPVLCKITVTTADDTLAAKVEPYAPSSSARFAAIRELGRAGLFAGVLLMPVLPYLEDDPDNIREIVHLAAENGARFIYPAFGMTLRANQRDWYYEKLDILFPGKRLREIYEKRYGNAYECRSPRAAALWKLFTEECGRHGLLYRMQDIIRGYKSGYETEQLRLF